MQKGGDEALLNAEEMRQKQDIGLSRGGKNTKIHALVDGLGNPIRLIFTGGEVHDSKEAIPLLEGFVKHVSNVCFSCSHYDLVIVTI